MNEEQKFQADFQNENSIPVRIQINKNATKTSLVVSGWAYQFLTCF
jgi:hypothetical protein